MESRPKEVRLIVAILCVAGLAAGVLLALRPPPRSETGAPGPAAPSSRLRESFDRPELDTSVWTLVADGDFQERRVDVQGGRLRLRCATIGTDDRTVKFLGVRSKSPVALRDGVRIFADLDWNAQANGCYLTGALVLAPAKTDGNPLTTPDWIKIEYVGVPPGRKGRLVVAQRRGGRDLPPFTEGWPEVRREGRAIGLQQIELVLRSGGVEVRENGATVFESSGGLPFESAHLYLLVSSHSNYPPRELFWDNVRIE